MAQPVPEPPGHAEGSRRTFRLIGKRHRPAGRPRQEQRRSRTIGIDVKRAGPADRGGGASAGVRRASLASAGRHRGARRCKRREARCCACRWTAGGEGVAVVADGYWAARQGRDALKADLGHGHGLERVDSTRQLAQYRALARASPARAHFDADLAPLERPRRAPHRGRVPLPLPGACADGAVELHRAAQGRRAGRDSGPAPSSPAGDAMAAAQRAGPEARADPQVNVQMAGGGFGRRGVPDQRLRGARPARSPGQRAPPAWPRRSAPLWSREDDMQGRPIPPDAPAPRPHRLRSSSGRVLAWDHVHGRPVHRLGHLLRGHDGQERHRCRPPPKA